MRSEEERVASGEGYIAVETLDEVVVQMVVAPGENVLYGLPFVEHIVYCSVLLRFGKHLFGRVCRHPVEFLTYDPEYGRRILLPPAGVVLHRPSVDADFVLVVLVVQVVDEPDDDLCVEVVLTVEPFPLHVLQACQAGEPPCQFPVR